MCRVPGRTPLKCLLSLCTHTTLCLAQVVGDRPCTKEYLRLQTSALALAHDPAELTKAKPFAVEVRATHTQQSLSAAVSAAAATSTRAAAAAWSTSYCCCCTTQATTNCQRERWFSVVVCTHICMLKRMLCCAVLCAVLAACCAVLPGCQGLYPQPRHLPVRLLGVARSAAAVQGQGVSNTAAAAGHDAAGGPAR